jgi:hypothetical protein
MHCSVIFACSFHFEETIWSSVSDNMLTDPYSACFLFSGSHQDTVGLDICIGDGRVGYLRLESSSLLEDSYLYICVIRY